MNKLIQSTRRPDITFARSGKIDIFARAARLLNLAKGDIINIAKINDEYMLFVQFRASEVVGRHSCTCYPTKTDGRHFRLNSVALCNEIRALVDIPDDRVSFGIGYPVDFEGSVMLPIITKRPL